jgi:hypothetical protein
VIVSDDYTTVLASYTNGMVWARPKVFFSHAMYDVSTTKDNSVALVRERNILTVRPPLVNEVSANFLRREGVTWSAQQIPTDVFLAF